MTLSHTTPHPKQTHPMRFTRVEEACMMSEENPNRKEPANPEPEIQKDSNSRQLYAKAMNKGRRYKREGREKVQRKIHAFYVRPFVRQIGTRGEKKGGANHRQTANFKSRGTYRKKVRSKEGNRWGWEVYHYMNGTRNSKQDKTRAGRGRTNQRQTDRSALRERNRKTAIAKHDR